MRACVIHGAGDLRVEEWPDRPPGSGEVTVEVEVGGICGSDLHYYRDGAVGDFRVVQPLVLGHEIAGRVVACGEGVEGPEPGATVAIHPATPCGACRECTSGHRNVCRRARYLGSAALVPHVQGGFRERLVVAADQLRLLPETMDLRRAVLAEPLSVALHAVRRAGPVLGRRVLVTGAGPIGCLVVAALRHAGAAEVVVSDLLDGPLALAARMGATSTVRADAPEDPAWPEEVDTAIEASGAPVALRTCVERARRTGTVVLLGLLPPGEVGLLANRVVTHELTLRGAFRFDEEFDHALSLLAGGLDVSALVTHTFPLAQAGQAFDLAGDRAVASKVLIDLAGG